MTKKSKVEVHSEPELVDPDMLVQATWSQETGEQVTSAIGKDGREYPDPVPVAPPLDYVPPPDLMTMIRSMIQSEKLRQRLIEEGFESFEEAEDFDIEDDPMDPLTPYEEVFLPPDQPEPRPAVPSASPEPATAAPSAEPGVSSPPAGSPTPPPTPTGTVPSS